MSRLRSFVALLSLLGLCAGGLATPPPARGAEYTLTTEATYQVLPDEREVAVSVEVTFKNTTPDPAGQFSLFEVVDLALHPGATGVSARDGEGKLNVSVADRDTFTGASVRPREGVRYQQTTTFTLSYTLPDAAGGTRIRPSLISFPVWTFGTAGTAEVRLPDTFEVTVDGDPMAASRADGTTVLESGEVDDPSNWLAQVIGIGPSSYRTVTRAVPLASGTVELQVRAWADDEAWGTRTLDLLAEALPLLEEVIGLPYPALGPLVVVESVSAPDAGIDAPTDEGTQLLAGYDQPPFTILHQAAHAWYSDSRASDRWLREGFASLAASLVAERMEVNPPYDPAARAEEEGENGFPLVSWGAGEATSQQTAWAYAAAWATAAEISEVVGEDRLRRAWQRMAAGVGPYESIPEDQPLPDHPGVPVQPADSRQLLDQLGAVSDADLDGLFADAVFDEETAALLPDRAEARAGASELVDASAGWGLPEPVKVDLAAWRFDSAKQRIEEAMGWLADRDVLLADADAAGLTVPQRLRDRYRTSGGGSDARTELAAEQAVVDAYASALSRSNEARNVIERLGLLGGPEPSAMLSEANTLFAEGELQGALDAVGRARERLDHATADGIVRLLAAVVLSLGVLAVAFQLARRRRSRGTSEYTAAP